ncbi:MAG TPA: cyanophycinase [Gemmatimonadaceae bacterium]|nr:cyanophycinase [Gemmatimonadaceae bacterium]
MSLIKRAVALIAVAAPACLFAQTSHRAAAPATKVGPPHGTVIVVGGGSMGPEVYNAFIQAAGGPNALIVLVPTAGGDTAYAQNYSGTRGWRAAGARNLYVLHTTNRTLADADSFVKVLDKAGGVWFDGGRQFHLVDSYAGTKTEKAFNDVLARGGVIAGSSAGASILGDFLVRGAPSNNNMIMDDPSHEKGFAYLRGVGIDQHVVARERLADLADSIVPKYPNLLAISEDEGTAWLVKGDTARIIGRNKAFVYNAKDKNDAGKPFITLYPGDRFNLATRRVMHRASSDAPFKIAYIDSLFKKYSDTASGATVLVAQNGEVFADKSYGIPPQAKYMPTTTVPEFSLEGLGSIINGICDQLATQRTTAAATTDSAAPAATPGATQAGRGRGGRGGPPMTALQSCVARGVSTPIGMHKTNATADGRIMSDVDELYRLSLGLENPRTYARDTTVHFNEGQGWTSDTYKGVARFTAYGTPDGKRNAYVRIPSKHATIIVLTNDEHADAKAIADGITDRLVGRATR